MSNHTERRRAFARRGHVTRTALSLLLSMCAAGAVAACGGTHGEAKAANSAQSAPATPPAAPAQATGPGTASGHAAAPGTSTAHGAPNAQPGAGDDQAEQGNDEDTAELVVSRDVVSRCPKLRLVRQHVAELNPDMVWLAVLESLGECMGQGGAMSEQNIGVSGDEEHRHVVREVLGTRGVAPTRVIATPTSAQGAAECQGGGDCSKRVEITVAPSP